MPILQINPISIPANCSNSDCPETPNWFRLSWIDPIPIALNRHKFDYPDIDCPDLAIELECHSFPLSLLEWPWDILHQSLTAAEVVVVFILGA